MQLYQIRKNTYIFNQVSRANYLVHFRTRTKSVTIFELYIIFVIFGFTFGKNFFQFNIFRVINMTTKYLRFKYLFPLSLNRFIVALLKRQLPNEFNCLISDIFIFFMRKTIVLMILIYHKYTYI